MPEEDETVKIPKKWVRWFVTGTLGLVLLWILSKTGVFYFQVFGNFTG